LTKSKSTNSRAFTGKLSPTIFSKAGWSLGWVSALDREGRTIWIVDAHRGDEKRFIVRADEMLTAFEELERAIYDFAVNLIL